MEAAFKLARWHTKRELNIAFFGAFPWPDHGSPFFDRQQSGSEREITIRLVPGITHIPYAYCYRCAYNLTYPKCDLYCVRWVEDTLFRTTVPAEEVGAIFVEPIQGEGGYIVPPPGFHKETQ